ncbi:PREDICTED: pentatricopeptide repeat-containing protein At4g38150 [Populus euphratica]|uniref:Pentatricopeptide repeat-containing protein At4g38150 n=1 Tax=Populus euphratica TaxID=75702 RepID=A0AAJ6V4A1_POPEU|nr:PREDICTED: pentatricopeptide repeat-containing protein At4g38150 [Populus euphratica]
MASSSSQSRVLKLLHSHSHTSLSQILRRFCSSVKGSTTGATFNFDDEKERRLQNQNPPDPIPNRPLRGERPNLNSNHNSGNIGGGGPNLNSDHSSSNKGGRGPKFNKNTNRPARPQPSHPPSTTSPFNLQPQTQTHDFNRISDDAFLDKFKLRPDHNNNVNKDAAAADTKAAAAPLPPKNEQGNSASTSEPSQDAEQIFNKMKETGLIPNAVAMLDGLCKDGLVQEALKLFGTMREKGTIPEVVIYTAVVDGFCKAHKLDDAKRIFRKMQSNGITPNAFSYAVLIQGLSKCNLFDDAIDFCFEMLELGHSPNVTTFVGLIDGLCREKGVEEARTVIGTLRQKGFHVHDKAVRDFLDKNKPLSSSVWDAIFGKKPSHKPF